MTILVILGIWISFLLLCALVYPPSDVWHSNGPSWRCWRIHRQLLKRWRLIDMHEWTEEWWCSYCTRKWWREPR